MSNIGSPQTRAKFNQAARSAASDAEKVGENISDLGNSVADMASRQYDQARDMVGDAVHDTGEAIRQNPYTAMGIGLGVGFLLGLVLVGGRR